MVAEVSRADELMNGDSNLSLVVWEKNRGSILLDNEVLPLCCLVSPWMKASSEAIFLSPDLPDFLWSNIHTFPTFEYC